MRYVIAASRPGYEGTFKRLKKKFPGQFVVITRKDQLTLRRLQQIKPRYVFLLHWSYLLPEELFNAYECVVFHMTDLPFGRGGSPLQNLIARGHSRTQISAIRCTGVVDGGPVYLKRPLSLKGNAEAIYQRAGEVVETMIDTFLKRRLTPQAQKGRVVHFKRRKPGESVLPTESLQKAYDWIRMLDAVGYPKAFLDWGRLHLEFHGAVLKPKGLSAHVTITQRPAR